ncbi:MAG: hypothetical protein ISR73_08150 [Gammaproteobacteria bacterium]|nr:hypothetical protein [Gammaproteobacteria bacterium]
MTDTELQQDRKRHKNPGVKPVSAAHVESVKQVLRPTSQRKPSGPLSSPVQPAPTPQEGPDISLLHNKPEPEVVNKKSPQEDLQE